jgi:hypothetical protein
MYWDFDTIFIFCNFYILVVRIRVGKNNTKLELIDGEKPAEMFEKAERESRGRHCDKAKF